MKLHWMHAGCLNAGWIDPASGPAAFVFDDRQLDAECWSLKRVMFLYECLLELPGVEIWRGPTAHTLAELARGRNLQQIVTVQTPDPFVQSEAAALAAMNLRVEWITPEPFVEIYGPVDLRRFSRYWRKAERALFA